MGLDDIRRSSEYDVALQITCVCGDVLLVPMVSADGIDTTTVCPNCGFRFVMSVPYSDSVKRMEFVTGVKRELWAELRKEVWREASGE